MSTITKLLFTVVISLSVIFGQRVEKIGVNERLSLDESKIIEFTKSVSLDWEKKVSPDLRIIVNKAINERSFQSFNEESFIKRHKNIPLIKTVEDNITIPVFIKTTDLYKIDFLISETGGSIQSNIGNIITAELDIFSIPELALFDEVEYIEASSISYPLLDVSRTEIKANQVHSGNGLSQSYQGDGVIVGVVDSGIDWEHPDFYNSQGSRIQYLWDMSGSSNPPSGYNYGREYTKAQIDAGQCFQIDGDDGGGHGTHVASTAAGNGGANTTYTGIAPKSDIIFVKGFRDGPGFYDTDVINGCNYIFTKAQAAGKPAVINLSLGGHFGPHDGTSLYEQSLSALTGQGKIIVAAAGNEGNDFIHLSYATSGSSINEANQTYWVIPSDRSMSVVDMWYNSGSISVGIAAYDKSLNFIGATSPISPGNKVEDLSFTVNGTTYAIVTIDATTTSDPNNGSRRVVFLIEDGNGLYDLGAVYWSLYTFGSGTFDAWIATGGYFTTDNYPVNGIYPGDNNRSIGMPSTAQKLICVGSYVTKTQWVDIDGVTRIQGGSPTLNAISSFSSIGPSRDGRLKPDITAPGEVIVAAFSNDLTIGSGGTPRSNIILGGKHQKMQGTSMATPHVTGVVALMLQRNSTLDYNQVFSTLTSTARRDSYTGSSSNNTYGYGKIDALASVQNTTGGGGGGTQVTLLQEGFDGQFPPSGWQRTITNTNNTWLQGNVTNHNFNTIDPASTASALCPWVAENQNEWLITPSLSLGTNSSVEFYAGYSTDWLSAATISLLISTDGVNYTQLWTAENDGQPWGWRNRSIDLSAYNNQSVKLAWRYLGNDGDYVGVDGVRVTTTQGATDVKYPDDEIPKVFSLYQNYPNPFNPSTTIEYDVPTQTLLKLIVYDVLGRKVKTLVSEIKEAGKYRSIWDGTNDFGNRLSSGIYIIRLETDKILSSMKVMMLK